MPSSDRSLILCVHAHQPVGNFDSVFEEAYEKAYRPFFEVLERHPAVPFCCHLSGSLLDWLEKHRPQFFGVLRKMSARGQLELLGGAYYEPIFGAIPKRDLVGQIEMMREKLRALFGKYPRGAWLTERVWDSHLVGPLRRAGVEFTILDDLHFERAGVKPPVAGYYQAREGSRTLDLFASLKQLRYLMPFKKAEETGDFISKVGTGRGEALVFADDCEKFGMWPGTYAWVYEEHWLDQFLELLEKSRTIRLYTFSQFRNEFKPKGVVKIRHSSYSEMMEWSGGHFYNFFNKYPESRYMRDRVWRLSGQIARTAARNGSAFKIKEARRALYRAQCNCTYWHGVFGGLYLHHLRSAVFENLIRAENLLAQAAQTKTCPAVRLEKLASGQRWRMRQKDLLSFFNARYGAALEELDFLPRSVNLMCNLQRHREPYHETVLKKASTPGAASPLSIHEILGSKEKDLEKHLYYDSTRRLSLMDHFFEEEAGLEDFSRSTLREIGDFVGTVFRVRRPSDGGLLFERKGHIRLRNKRFPLVLAKRVAPKGPSALRVLYQLRNIGSEPLHFAFGVEFNFSIGEDFAARGLSEKNVREWIFNDAWRGIRIRLFSEHPVTLLAAPVETISESECGLEKTYQELAVLLQRPFFLKPNESMTESLELECSSKRN